MNGLPQAALILIAAAGISAVAFMEPIKIEQTNCPYEPQVIRFMPIPEPLSLIPTPGWTWPMDKRLDRFETDDPVPEPQLISGEEKQYRPHYRYMRPRRHWR